MTIGSKVTGGLVPALLTGLNVRGGTRIGVGMLSGGEVALIFAGIGLAEGVIGGGIPGIFVPMTGGTAIVALMGPVFLYCNKPTAGEQWPESGLGARASQATTCRMVDSWRNSYLVKLGGKPWKLRRS